MKIEVIIFGLAMLVIGFWAGHKYAMTKVFGHTMELMHEVLEDHAEMKVRAVAKKYSWHFHYPGPDGEWGKTRLSDVTVDNPLGLDADDPASLDDFISPELVLPCGTRIGLKVDSHDVIHSLGELHGDLELDAIPGVKSETSFQSPEEPNAGRLRCVQLCGPGHKDHHAPYRFVTKAEFEAWQDAQR